jgi:hypothetical protein
VSAKWLTLGAAGVALAAVGVGVVDQARAGWSVLVGGLAGLAFFATSSANVRVASWVAGMSRGLGLAQVLLGFVLRLLVVSAVFAVAVSLGLPALPLGLTLIVATLVWLVVLVVQGWREKPPVASPS